MSILDDAIREHLELKRAHGADEAELKKLEDEAFGPAERPGSGGDAIDPFAEAPTEFLAAPEAEPETGGRQLPNIADLQEPPPPKPAGDAPTDAGTGAVPAPDIPAQEEHPAGEHEIVATPAEEDAPPPPSDALRPDPGAPAPEVVPAAGEPPAIVDQPTEMFDVEQQLFEDTAESASPSDEQLIEAEQGEPRITPAPAEEPADEFDEFFSEQRLSDELNQALEAPLPDEPGAPSTDEAASPFLDPEAELGPAPVEEPTPEPPIDRTVEQRLPEEEEDAEEYQPHEPGHADALEDTPEFLEDEPEGDDAWFEQKPPKDFDFGD